MTSYDALERARECLVKVQWADRKQAKRLARLVGGLNGLLLYWFRRKWQIRFAPGENVIVIVEVDVKTGACKVWDNQSKKGLRLIWSGFNPPKGDGQMIMAKTGAPYTDHFDSLIALVTHLAATEFKSRRVSSMARDLGIEETEVRTVLNGFPGFFRKSRRLDGDGDPYYTLHLRYARRPPNDGHKGEKADEGGEEERNDALKPEELSTLLDLISKMVAHEKETSRLFIDHSNQMKKQFWISAASIGIAGLAAWATLLAAVLKSR